MTRRKPLRWISTDYGDLPACATCVDWIALPGMREAVASTSIERPVNLRVLVEDFHTNRHRED